MDAFYNIIDLLLLLYDTSIVTWKIFAGHRFSTQFFHKQIFLLALSGRPEQQTSSPEIWAKCSLSNVLCSLSNVLCCLPQLQSLRSILSKNNSKTFWCRQPATLLKPTPSQDLPVELCERFQNSYSVEHHWATSSLVIAAGSSYFYFRQLDLFFFIRFLLDQIIQINIANKQK